MKDERFAQGLARLQYLLHSRSNLTPIFVIDEAHLLKTDAITDLRLLVSSPLDSSAHLKIVLSGQEHLKYILKRDVHADFAQRIR